MVLIIILPLVIVVIWSMAVRAGQPLTVAAVNRGSSYSNNGTEHTVTQEEKEDLLCH